MLQLLHADALVCCADRLCCPVFVFIDVVHSMMSNYEVIMGDGNSSSDFYVKFRAPTDSVYAGGIYKIHITLPVEYPYKSPSVGFCTRIFHPNIDEASGSVCLDVINQTWSPMYDLTNIFNVFLPQLLLYPNPADPLNPAAAKLYFNKRDEYDAKCKNYVKMYASVDFAVDEEDSQDASNADDDADDKNAMEQSKNHRSGSSATCDTTEADEDELQMSDLDGELDGDLSEPDEVQS